jgi:monoamine oxidase
MPQSTVCIVGAGIAGLSAGYTLKKQGVNDIRILEAASVIGGRIKDADLSFAQDFPIALGAEWIHVDPKILNEITGEKGTDDKVQTVYHDINPVKFWIFNRFFLPVWIPRALSGNNYKWVNFSWFDFLNEFLVPSVKNDIDLNRHVTRINYEDESAIKVYTAQGDVYKCDRVIVTVSLQMLKDGAITFEPPLSDEKIIALEGSNMPKGFKLIMEFREKFYPKVFNHVKQLLFHGEGGYFDSTYGQATDKNLLVLLCVGDYTFPYFNELDNMFGGKASETLIKWTYEEWSPEAKPYIRGAYSWSYKNGENDIKILSTPIDGRIYFAGEALPLDRRKIGYAHNAALSGKNAATLISSSVL